MFVSLSLKYTHTYTLQNARLFIPSTILLNQSGAAGVNLVPFIMCIHAASQFPHTSGKQPIPLSGAQLLWLKDASMTNQPLLSGIDNTVHLFVCNMLRSFGHLIISVAFSICFTKLLCPNRVCFDNGWKASQRAAK